MSPYKCTLFQNHHQNQNTAFSSPPKFVHALNPSSQPAGLGKQPSVPIQWLSQECHRKESCTRQTFTFGFLHRKGHVWDFWRCKAPFPHLGRVTWLDCFMIICQTVRLCSPQWCGQNMFYKYNQCLISHHLPCRSS